jgi:hypothetical protein
MSTASTVGAFLFALAATLGATEVVVWDLSHLRVKVGLAAGLLGLLTALRADAAEVSSASSGPFSGAREVGVGVISNPGASSSTLSESWLPRVSRTWPTEGPMLRGSGST